MKLRDYNNSTPVKRKLKSPVVKLINNEIQTSKLESQIKDYIINDSLSVSLINDYKNQLVWKEEMIDLVKPKWYDNKYLWFFGGMIITSGAVYLAGQID